MSILEQVSRRSSTTKRTAVLGGGGGLGAVVVWLWSIFMPNQPIPLEVAAVIGSGASFVIGTLVSKVLR